MTKTLIILTGAEGTGKTTLAKKLLPHMWNAASFDAENILQVNPFIYGRKFVNLSIQNSVSLISNFFDAGYNTVLAGSFIGNLAGYDAFRKHFRYRATIYVVMLTASKPVRDKRRIKRDKPSTKRFRDKLDKKYPFDPALRDAKRDYTYIEIDNSRHSIKKTVQAIRKAIPEAFRDMPRGTIAQFDEEAGNGLIEREDGSEIRFHRTALAKPSPKPGWGDLVAYDTGEDESGSIAVNVIIIRPRRW